MTDKEMLEYAAKAAGVELVWHGDTDPWCYAEIAPGIKWNPLTDDGDALRLAVRLGLHARQFPIIDDGFDAPLGMVEVWRVDDDDPAHVEFLRSGDDRLVATRRAIVRAAAEIGKGVARPVSDDLPEDNYYKSMAEAEETGRAVEMGRKL